MEQELLFEKDVVNCLSQNLTALRTIQNEATRRISPLTRAGLDSFVTSYLTTEKDWTYRNSQYSIAGDRW